MAFKSLSIPSIVANGDTITPRDDSAFSFLIQDYQGRNISTFGSVSYKVSLEYHDGSVGNTLKINAKAFETYQSSYDQGSFPPFILTDSAFTGSKNVGYRIVITGETFRSVSDTMGNLVRCSPTCGVHGSCKQDYGLPSSCACEDGWTGIRCLTPPPVGDVSSDSMSLSEQIRALVTTEEGRAALFVFLLALTILSTLVIFLVVSIVTLTIVMYTMKLRTHRRHARVFASKEDEENATGVKVSSSRLREAISYTPKEVSGSNRKSKMMSSLAYVSRVNSIVQHSDGSLELRGQALVNEDTRKTILRGGTKLHNEAPKRKIFAPAAPKSVASPSNDLVTKAGEDDLDCETL